MGVGQLINGKYTVLSETTMGWSKNQFGALHVAVGLWWIEDLGSGNYERIALTQAEVDAVTEQVGNTFKLEITPASGQTSKLEPEENDPEAAAATKPTVSPPSRLRKTAITSNCRILKQSKILTIN